MSTRHPALARDPANLVAGRWSPIPGESLRSRNPARPAEVVWSATPDRADVDRAVLAAREALPRWSARTLDQRAHALRKFQALAQQRAEQLASLIRDEVGKPMWDARAEALLLPAKVDVTLDESPHAALHRVRGFDLELSASRRGRCWFRPHGVMGVLAPFNFPAHLPNGHIVPALLMGNTVVLKPSEKTPAVGQFLAELFADALEDEPGVVNLVQGAADVASALASHRGVDGILFTGSWPVGRSILQGNLDQPGKILALEMGGNNPAIVDSSADLTQALTECVRSAFVTAGQRCTCTRRIIVLRDVASRFIPALCQAASALALGDPRDERTTFLGPLISERARDATVDACRSLARGGAGILVPSVPAASPGGGWYATPGVVRVDRFGRGGAGLHADPGDDVEIFGPLVRVSVADTLDDAIEQGNATDFGLAASIFSRDPSRIDQFLARARAGCLNVNTGTAGASSKLPFGGLGKSGNHRPAGAYSLDYCAYPVAGMIESASTATTHPGMRIDPAWLA